MKKTILLIWGFLLATICFTSCGVKSGSVELFIDDDVTVSKIIITKSSGSKYTKYDTVEETFKQGDTWKRTLGKGKYYIYMKAKGGPTYTKDKNRMLKIDNQYNQLYFEITDGEVTQKKFSEAIPNVMLITY